MANRGESKSLKRLAAPRTRSVAVKAKKWTYASNAGTHSKDSSVPLGYVVRDSLGLAQTAKEVKQLLNKRTILIDGTVRISPHFQVGLFDSISIPLQKKHYRCVFDVKGRAQFISITDKEATTKLCRVKKKTLHKKKVQLVFHDGRSLLIDKTNLKVNDSVILKVPEQTIEKDLPLKEGALVYFFAGKHTGKIAKVTGILPGTEMRHALINLEEEGVAFQTLLKNVVVVGEGKPALQITGEKNG